MVELLVSEKTEIESWHDFIMAIYISERAKLANHDLEQKEERRGRKSKQQETKANGMRENFSHLTGRTDVVVAKKYGFKNRKTLHQAIYVTQHGCAEAIHAMDKDIIKVYLAAKVATLPETQQRQLLTQTPKVIRAYFKKEKSKTTHIDIPSLLHAIQIDAVLKEAEQITQKSIIKHVETMVQTFCY